MEIRIYDTSLRLTAVREDIETLTAREEYRGAGEISFVLRRDGVKTGDFVRVPDTETGYFVTSVREEADGRTTVTGRAVLWLFSRAIVGGTRTVCGRASDVLGILASDTGRAVLPAWLNILVPTGTREIEVTVGRCSLLEALCEIAAVGDVGLKMTFSPAYGENIGTFNFSARPKKTAERFLSASLGNIGTLTRLCDESRYANFAFAEGADGTTVTVDRTGGERLAAVYVNANDLSPARCGADYEAALTRRAESVLAGRSRTELVTVTTDEPLTVGQVVEVRSPIVSGQALCTARIVTFADGRTRVRTELGITPA